MHRGNPQIAPIPIQTCSNAVLEIPEGIQAGPSEEPIGGSVKCTFVCCRGEPNVAGRGRTAQHSTIGRRCIEATANGTCDADKLRINDRVSGSAEVGVQVVVSSRRVSWQYT